MLKTIETPSEIKDIFPKALLLPSSKKWLFILKIPSLRLYRFQKSDKYFSSSTLNSIPKYSLNPLKRSNYILTSTPPHSTYLLKQKIVYPPMLPRSPHSRMPVYRPSPAPNLSAVSPTQSFREAVAVKRVQYFDPVRLAAEENSRQPLLSPPRMLSRSPLSSPSGGIQNMEPALPNRDPRGHSLPEARAHVNQEASLSPLLNSPPNRALTPVSASFPAAILTNLDSGAPNARAFTADDVEPRVSEYHRPTTSSSSASPEEVSHPGLRRPRLGTHHFHSYSSFASRLTLNMAQRQHELLLDLERICAAAAGAYLYPQPCAAADRPSNPQGQPLQSDRARDTVMEYLREIAVLLWTRARAGELSEKIEAVYQIDKLYALGKMVSIATVTAGATALREQDKYRFLWRQREPLGFIREEDEDVSPTDLNAPTNFHEPASVPAPTPASAPEPESIPAPASAPERARSRSGIWIRTEGTLLYILSWILRSEFIRAGLPPPSSPLDWAEPPRAGSERVANDDALFTKEELLRIMLAGRDLVVFLLSKDGKRDVDELMIREFCG